MNSDDQESPPKRPWNRRKASSIAAFTAGGIGVVFGTYGMVNPQRYVVLVDRQLTCSFAIMAGLLTIGFGMAFVPARRRVREIVEVGVVLVAFAVPCATGFVENFEKDSPTSPVAASPDGKYEIVVEKTLHRELSPVSILYLQSRNGLFSRRDMLGCFNLDNGREFLSATFVGKTRLAITGVDRTDYEGDQVKDSSKTWTLRFDRGDVKALDKLPRDACDASSQFHKVLLKPLRRHHED